MIHPALSLQAALYSRLTTSNDIIVALGGEHIFDDIPISQQPPYIVFAESVHNDWSTGTEEGAEHSVSIHVWSDQSGRKHAVTVAQFVIEAMNDLPRQLDDHILVNFSHEFTEVSRDEDEELYLAKINFRAVTEPQTQT